MGGNFRDLITRFEELNTSQRVLPRHRWPTSEHAPVQDGFISDPALSSDMVRNDSVTTIDDLKAMVTAFCDERDWGCFHTSKELAIGLVTEASELLQVFRFKNDEQVSEMMSGPRRQDVIDELCDSLYFILRFAHVNGIDLSSGLEDKIRRNAEKYPVDVCKGKNLKYDEY